MNSRNALFTAEVVGLQLVQFCGATTTTTSAKRHVAQPTTFIIDIQGLLYSEIEKNIHHVRTDKNGKTASSMNCKLACNIS